MSDPLTDAANAISTTSPKVRAFAQMAAQRTIDLESRVAALQPPAPTPTRIRWFSDTKYANRTLPATLPLDPNNAAYRSALAGMNGIYGNGIGNGGAWSAPVYRASAATPLRAFTLAVPSNGASSITVPWDAAWKPSPDTDAHAIIFGTDGKTFTEFQGLDIPYARAHSAAIGNITTWDGFSTAANNTAPISTAVGLIRPEEIAAGVIEHQIRCALPITGGPARWPAQHQDGTGNGPPCGACLALPRTADLSSLTGDVQRVVARAMQEYGLRVSDWAGDPANPLLIVYFQSTADGVTRYPVTGFSMPKQILTQLVVLAAGA